jgi:serine-type D-Ala-D-Ala carboxypeptidase (penicillin-binding protein 5/6)
MSSSAPRQGVLTPRRRKRRPLAGLAAGVALALAPLTVAVAAYLAFVPDDPSRRADAAVAARSTATPAPPTTIEARDPVASAPAPNVPLTGVDAFHVRLRTPPRAGLVVDVDTGDVLWRRQPLKVLPIASLTKIMTALLVANRARPRERVRITRAALGYQGSGVGVLPRGKRVPLEALLNGLLLVSGNDAAIALAGHVAGSERRFVALMNERAKAWGLGCTRFVSTHGLEAGNRSCARDLAVLTRLAMAERRIRRIARRRQASFRFPIKGGRLFLLGHNPLLRLGYRGAIGLKTGYTDEAGRCFVGVARRGRRTMAVVLLNSPDPGKQAARLLNEGFARE